MPSNKKRNRDEDDNRLSAVTNLDLKNPGVSVLKLPSAHRLFDIPNDSYVHVTSQETDGASIWTGWYFYAGSSASSYLTSRNELQRSQRAPHVWDVGLQVVESVGYARLDLGRILPRRAVWRDFVQ